MSQISKATQSSESDTDFIQDITIWFIDVLLTINMNMCVWFIPTDPDEVFVIAISYKLKNNNKIRSLDLRF
jgi:hypothetical protein